MIGGDYYTEGLTKVCLLQKKHTFPFYRYRTCKKKPNNSLRIILPEKLACLTHFNKRRSSVYDSKNTGN